MNDSVDDIVKILIADDHYLVVEGIKTLLENEEGFQIVGIASTGLQVLDLVAVEEPDLILMDINMPELDGIQTTKRIIRAHPNIKVIVISMYNTIEFIANALDLGATGYLLKNTSKEELHQAIDVVMAGGVHLSEEVKEVYDGGYSQRQEFIEPHSNILTLKEMAVLKLLVKEKSHIEIGDELKMSPNTVKTHRRNIMSKLNVKNFAGMVKFAIHRGWE